MPAISCEFFTPLILIPREAENSKLKVTIFPKYTWFAASNEAVPLTSQRLEFKAVSWAKSSEMTDCVSKWAPAALEVAEDETVVEDCCGLPALPELADVVKLELGRTEDWFDPLRMER